MSASATTYECVIGFDHEPPKGKNRRFEPGDTVPATIASKTLLELGAVRAVTVATDG